MSEYRKLTQEEFLAEATERFGSDHWQWKARCYHCGDVASLAEFRDAGADPGKWGQECLGRTLGKDVRGCDFAAYGLIPGPWEMVLPSEDDKPGTSIRCFALAEASAS